VAEWLWRTAQDLQTWVNFANTIGIPYGEIRVGSIPTLVILFQYFFLQPNWPLHKLPVFKKVMYLVLK
jgi:hypothetical protein